jgi:MYXO-CTERM domain-containing protein
MSKSVFGIALVGAVVVGLGCGDTATSTGERASSAATISSDLRVDSIMWSQQAELVAADGLAGDDFGLSVSLKGDLAIVGAPNKHNGANLGPGAAYVFVRSGTTWALQAELAPSDGATGDAFGTSVAIDVGVNGTMAVVGAPNKAVGGNASQGAAYVFAQSGTSWSQQAELTYSFGGAGDVFGSSVALGVDLSIGPTVVIGAPHAADGVTPDAGVVDTFRLSAVWTEDQGLVGSGVSGNLFGASVAVGAISGTPYVMIGAPGDGGPMHPGEAYLFSWLGGIDPGWLGQGSFSGDAANDSFGASVAFSGSTAVAGAPGADGNRGAAYTMLLFNGTTWAKRAKLVDPNGVAGDELGQSVAVAPSENTVLAGAPFKSASRGSVVVFTGGNLIWSEQTEITGQDSVAGDAFGRSMVMDGSTVLVGAMSKTVGANASQGAAYAFVLGACTPLTVCPAPDNCGFVDDTCGGAVSCGSCSPDQTCTANQCMALNDAGVDSGFDAGVDSGVDSGIDGGVDSGVDASMEVDAGIDSGMPADSGVGVDAGGTDAGGATDSGSIPDSGGFDGGGARDSGSGADAAAPLLHDAGSGPDSGSAADAANVVAPGADTSGCSCKTAGAPLDFPSNESLAAIGALALAATRRRRKRQKPS